MASWPSPPHGFSAFTVTAEDPVVRNFDKSYGYTDIQAAFDEADNSEIVFVEQLADDRGTISSPKTFYMEWDDPGEDAGKYTLILHVVVGYDVITERADAYKVTITVYAKSDTSSGGGLIITAPPTG